MKIFISLTIMLSLTNNICSQNGHKVIAKSIQNYENTSQSWVKVDLVKKLEHSKFYPNLTKSKIPIIKQVGDYKEYDYIFQDSFVINKNNIYGVTESKFGEYLNFIVSFEYMKLDQYEKFAIDQSISNYKRYLEEKRIEQERLAYQKANRVEIDWSLKSILGGISYLAEKASQSSYIQEKAQDLKDWWNTPTNTSTSSSTSNHTNIATSASTSESIDEKNSLCEKEKASEYGSFKSKVVTNGWTESTFNSNEHYTFFELGGGGFADLTGRKVTRWKQNDKEVFEYTGDIGGSSYTYYSLEDYTYAVYLYRECRFISDKGRKNK